MSTITIRQPNITKGDPTNRPVFTTERESGSELSINSFAAIDFETATGSRDSACAVGVVIVDNWTTTWETHQFIRPPENKYDALNTQIHGIGPETTSDALEFCDIWPDIAERIGDRPLIAHNASFDMSVLQRSCSFYDMQLGDLSFACTLQLSEETWPQLYSHKLDKLAIEFGINLNHHHALSDAKAAAKLVEFICREHGVPTITKAVQNLDIQMGRVSQRGVYSLGRFKEPKERITHFVDYRELEIDCLDEDLIVFLVRSGLIKDIGDLFFLRLEDLIATQGMGSIAAQYLLDGLDKALSGPLVNLVDTFKIHLLGPATSHLLAHHYGDLDLIIGASADELSAIKGVGAVTAKNIVSFFTDPKNIVIIDKLRKAGVSFNNVPNRRIPGTGADLTGVLAGKVVVLTGDWGAWSLDRKEAKKAVIAAGGKCTATVSASTYALVAGKNAGPAKLKKAMENNIPILDEDGFRGLFATGTL